MPKTTAAGTLPDVSRILFLGDSITYSGHYITLLETAIRIQHPERDVELLNLGLPSETVSGLSEPGHACGQFPRPHLHERLTRVLDEVRPDLVVACYGMNDGIYFPLREDRFLAYREGIMQLRTEVQRRGAELLLLTPAMFDAQPIADRLLPDGLETYPQPYKNYDDVLEHYAQWLLTKRMDHWNVVDVHGAMKTAVLERRKTEPNFTFAADGVHPNEAGHEVIAQALADHWGLDLNTEPVQASDDIRALVAKKQENMKHAWLTRTKHLRPGIPAGQSLEEAEKSSAGWKQQISDLVGRD
ncbi:MAG: SGNH/GDSL hydrolase family protein [Planctomycetaceae bacterium]|nr:SGNH/GDSL hydrolase family protein [Planctomycetaceae bacterium]